MTLENNLKCKASSLFVGIAGPTPEKITVPLSVIPCRLVQQTTLSQSYQLWSLSLIGSVYVLKTGNLLRANAVIQRLRKRIERVQMSLKGQILRLWARTGTLFTTYLVRAQCLLSMYEVSVSRDTTYQTMELFSSSTLSSNSHDRLQPM